VQQDQLAFLLIFNLSGLTPAGHFGPLTRFKKESLLNQ
jgi:hypothetical protein